MVPESTQERRGFPGAGHELCDPAGNGHEEALEAAAGTRLHDEVEVVSVVRLLEDTNVETFSEREEDRLYFLAPGKERELSRRPRGTQGEVHAFLRSDGTRLFPFTDSGLATMNFPNRKSFERRLHEKNIARSDRGARGLNRFYRR